MYRRNKIQNSPMIYRMLFSFILVLVMGYDKR